MTAVIEPDEISTDTGTVVVEAVADSDHSDQPEATARPAHGDVAGELLWLDPHTLTRARNRPVHDAEPGLADSVREHGNLIPLVVRRCEGRTDVHDGWHRVEALLTQTEHLALCAVYPESTSLDQINREIERIQLQFNTGAHRITQSAADRFDAYQQMFELNLPVAEIQKRLVGTSRNELASARKVSASPAAVKAVQAAELDLVQAALVAEHFPDDAAALALLVTAAAQGQFDHRLQQLRDERLARAEAERVQAAFDAVAGPFDAAGIEVLEATVADEVSFDYVPLERLRDGEGNPATRETVAAEHLAVLLVRQAEVVETGQRIGYELIDEATHLRPEDDPDPGMYHINEVRLLDEWTPVLYCYDPGEAGLIDLDRVVPAEETPEDPDEDPAVLAERRAAAEAEAQERMAAERERAAEAARRRAETDAQIAKVELLEKKARTATTVRRDHLTKKLFGGDRKTVPPGSWELIGAVLPHNLLAPFHTQVMVDVLGTKVPNSPTGTGIKVRDNHGAMRALLRVIAALEADLQSGIKAPTYWRSSSSLHRQYFEFLISTGYQLADIERTVLGEITGDEIAAAAAEPAVAVTDADTDAGEEPYSDQDEAEAEPSEAAGGGETDDDDAADRD